MPAQIVVREHTAAEVKSKIVDLKATELLELVEQDGDLIVRCKPDSEGTGSAKGAAVALQAVADLDALRVRATIAKAKKQAADAKTKAEREAKDAAAAAKAATDAAQAADAKKAADDKAKAARDAKESRNPTA